MSRIFFMCARRVGNGANDQGSVCEGRTCWIEGDLALRGDEVTCAECGRVTCFTRGIHGNAWLLKTGSCVPDPVDPRNRALGST